MPDTIDREPTAAMSALLGAPVLLRVRRLIVAALITSLLYSIVMTATRSGCPGGVTGDGGYLDANGQPTDFVPQCYNFTLGPSVWVFVAIALTVVLAITRVLKKAGDLRNATRILDRAAMIVFAIAGASVLIGYVWFFLIPIDTSDGTGTLYLPLPFGNVTLDVHPIGT
jgi:ABC-type Fe3+ transport system permease subunit